MLDKTNVFFLFVNNKKKKKKNTCKIILQNENIV